MNENLNKDLYVKCERKTPKEVRDILRKGADPNGYCDDNGWFPLHKSAIKDDKDLAEALVQHGARGDVVTHRGILPLHLAALARRTEVLPVLLGVTRDKNKQDHDGDTALHMAVTNNATEAVRLLAPLTNLTMRNKKEETPIDVAIRCDNRDIVQILINKQ